jgi:hypothetical protein
MFPERSRGGCRGSDIAAFELVASLFVSYVTVTGTLGFFNLFGVVDNTEIFADQFYARSTYVEDYLVYPMLCYQLWNSVCCLLLADFRTIDAILHHVVTGCLAYFGLAPFAQCYALFYFGMAESSTIPLNAMNVFKILPGLAKKYPDVQNVVKISFSLSFFLVRIIVWPFVSYRGFFGCMDLLSRGTAHSTFVVGFFLFANIFLTFLQFYWGYLIGRKALIHFLGGNKGSKKIERGEKYPSIVPLSTSTSTSTSTGTTSCSRVGGESGGGMYSRRRDTE